MTHPLELFYDFRSPYSYLAFIQLHEMEVEIALRPMNNLNVIEKVGNVPTTITCQAKSRYVRTDLRRWAQRYGVIFNPANMREADGDACLRAVLTATSPAEASAITLALFRACWSEGNTLATIDDILAALTAAGIDAAPVAERINAPEIVARLDANNDEAAQRDVFGAPTIFVGDAMFFGNDRLDFVREELARLEQPA
jgi:2-hydroxychromene-2-carboxylate isomerase